MLQSVLVDRTADLPSTGVPPCSSQLVRQHCQRGTGLQRQLCTRGGERPEESRWPQKQKPGCRSASQQNGIWKSSRPLIRGWDALINGVACPATRSTTSLQGEADHLPTVTKLRRGSKERSPLGGITSELITRRSHKALWDRGLRNCGRGQYNDTESGHMTLVGTALVSGSVVADVVCDRESCLAIFHRTRTRRTWRNAYAPVCCVARKHKIGMKWCSRSINQILWSF